MQHTVAFDAQVVLPSSIDQESILSLVTHVLNAEDVDDSWSIGIQFVDDPTMQAAHAEFMDINEPTDIMTFPYSDGDDPWAGDEAGGDLMISVDRARLNAIYAGWREEDEIFFLIAHGILHILGWDDLDEPSRERMLSRQKELLESWDQRP